MADNDRVLGDSLRKTIHRLAIAGVSLIVLLVAFSLGAAAAPRNPQARHVFSLIIGGLVLFGGLYGILTTVLVRWMATRWEHVALIHIACAGATVVPIIAAMVLFGFRF